MPSSQAIARAEQGVIVIFLAWLAWLPLPFGSVVEGARLPLIAMPIALCAVAAVLRAAGTSDRVETGQPALPWAIGAGGLFLLIGVGVIQLLPLPAGVVRLLSGESHAIWSRVANLAALADLPAPSFHLTVNPRATAFEIFRLLAIGATFTTAAILFRNHQRRSALAIVLSLAAIFESMYGLRESALQRFEIWGWVNRLIFDRVTGTFVNPNHFAYYLAIILPLPIFFIAVQWQQAGTPRLPVLQRLIILFEKGAFRAGMAMLAAIICGAGILLAQSRGALLALVTGTLIIVALLPGKKLLKVVATGLVVLVLLSVLIVFLGQERTARRFVPAAGEVETLVGRRIGISTALSLWRRFPLFGSGLGTFSRVVSMEQRADLGKIYMHAHNDYAEMLTTGGLIGGGISVVALFAGWVALWRMTFHSTSDELSRRRRAWQTAALASLTIAMIHALFDFNFFIPSNPATLAAIVGAAVSSVDHDRRSRR